MPQDFRSQVAPQLRVIAESLETTFTSFTHDTPPRLVEAMRYSLLGGGKRLRPLLCVLACEAAGGTIAQALPGACAVEMIHAYSLIHDDLPAMDDDDLRRGQPTCHKQFDEATAILAGDALLTMAFDVLASGCPPRTAAVSCAELAKGAGAAGMVGGQILDLFPSLCGDEMKLEEIHRRKTGALFRSSLRLGLYAAQAEIGVNPDALAAIDAYSAAFGVAFQVTDDILDVTGTAEATGKNVGKDLSRGKLTYPGLIGLEASRAKAHTLCCKAIDAAKSLGPRGERLANLAEYVVTRDR
jgi:geranylgeranyl diphosphate synthase type II